MQSYRIETVVTQDGSLILKDLPLKAGQKVEIIIFSRVSQGAPRDRYPLRGTPIEYRLPFESVADSDWDVLQ